MNWQEFVSAPVPPSFIAVAGLLLTALILWSIVWKGLALWKAAKEGNKAWFIILLVVNTVGILDILYLYVFSRKSGQQPIEPPKM